MKESSRDLDIRDKGIAIRENRSRDCLIFDENRGIVDTRKDDRGIVDTRKDDQVMGDIRKDVQGIAIDGDIRKDVQGLFGAIP